jgi:hypothetical protein
MGAEEALNTETQGKNRSQATNFSIDRYCENEASGYRALLRDLPAAEDAMIT